MVTEIATQELARARAARIRAGIATYLHTLADVSAAYAQRDWTALGYADWQAYVDGEYGAERLRLSPEHRAKAVAELRLAGMSTRAIGSTLGLSHQTVQRELASGPDGPVQPERIVSLDGRERPASRPQTPAPMPEPGPEASTSTGPGHNLGDAMAEAIEQARERVAQQRAEREALYAPREVVDAVNAATHFTTAMVAIQTGCEGLLSQVRDVDPEQAVADLPENWRSRLDVARDAHAYLTRVVDALNRIGVAA